MPIFKTGLQTKILAVIVKKKRYWKCKQRKRYWKCNVSMTLPVRSSWLDGLYATLVTLSTFNIIVNVVYVEYYMLNIKC